MWNKKSTEKKLSDLLSDGEDSNNVKLLYNYLFSEVINEIDKQKDDHFKDFFANLDSEIKKVCMPRNTDLALEIKDLKNENKWLRERLENIEEILFHLTSVPPTYFREPPSSPTII